MKMRKIEKESKQEQYRRVPENWIPFLMSEYGKFDLKANVEAQRDWLEIREHDRHLWDAMYSLFRAVAPRMLDQSPIEDPSKVGEYNPVIGTMIAHLSECASAWDVFDLVSAVWELWFDGNSKLKDGQGEDIAVIVWMFWKKRCENLARLVMKESTPLFQVQCPS